MFYKIIKIKTGFKTYFYSESIKATFRGNNSLDLPKIVDLEEVYSTAQRPNNHKKDQEKETKAKEIRFLTSTAIFSFFSFNRSNNINVLTKIYGLFLISSSSVLRVLEMLKYNDVTFVFYVYFAVHIFYNKQTVC